MNDKQEITTDSKTQPNGGGLRFLFSTHHRVIGIGYLLLSLAAVIAGSCLALFMRIHLAWPQLALPLWGQVKPEDYLSLVTMHGTLMVFFVVTTAPLSGFANLVLPEQLGSTRMALPRVNALSFWLTVTSFFVLLSAFLLPGGGPISGWSNYPPLSAIAAAGPGQGAGMDAWLISIGIFCIASSMGAVNLLSTIANERCEGMTAWRMPLTVWSWFVASLLTLLVFSVLFVAALLLYCDRHFGTAFFIPAGEVINGLPLANKGDGTPLLWLHLFWFFGHPEVYIAILPGMGITSSLLANFSRRPVLGYRMMAVTTVLIGLLGFLVWGHHMFVSGLNPYAGSAFALVTMAIAVPSSAKVLSWIGTILGGGLEFTTPMLFSLGFVSLFVTGGLSGPLLSLPILDQYLHNTFFVVAHFHLIMAMAGVFSIFAGIYYWFPLLSGRYMHEGLGKLHFALTFLAAYSTFLPMHFTGLAGEPRHYSDLTVTPFISLQPLQRHITASAILLVSAQLLFLFNLIWSLRTGKPAEANPWRATTLEWARVQNSTIVRCGPYEYRIRPNGMDYLPQNESEAGSA